MIKENSIFQERFCFDETNVYGNKASDTVGHPAPISTTSLDTNNLHLLPASLHTNDVQNQLVSQGFFTSSDQSYAYSHESSVCLSSWQCDGVQYVVNMDRGGVVERPDGSHAACIADGCGGDGYFSAFVAQMICDYFL